RHAPASPETDEQSEAASRLFLLFLDLFDTVVLPTFKSRYTQFVLFYLCAKDTQYADVFLGTMVGKVGEPVRSTAQDRVSRVLKVAAAAYLGSFVARAKFLDAPIVRSVVSVLVQWANTYLDWHEQQQHEAEKALGRQQSLLRKRTYAQTLGDAVSGSRASATPSPLLAQKQTLPQQQQQQTQMELERHGVFYAVTQAVLYMFCFRWRDMAEAAGGGPVVESELDNLRWCRELDGLQRVVFSRLNPLRACAPAVAQQFASVSSQTSFMFCYAMLQQNRRSNRESFAAAGPITAGVSDAVRYNGTSGDSGSASGASSDQAMRARLDSFFPFDPMALPVSRQFIDSIYLEWQDVGEEPSDDDDDGDDGYHGIPGHSPSGVNIPSAADGYGDEGEDNVIEQIVAMSISPVVPLAVVPGHRSG
ncbi:DNA independent RNA polymerase I transcription factor, partial [Coemansia guatemalensis]